MNSPCDMLWLNASGLEHLPARAQDVKSSCDMLRLMQTLRRIIPRYIASTACRTTRIDRFYAARPDSTSASSSTALAALYAGPDCYYINFYGPPGTIRTIPYESFVEAGMAL